MRERETKIFIISKTEYLVTPIINPKTNQKQNKGDVMRKHLIKIFLVLILFGVSNSLIAQGVTTAGIQGIVTDKDGDPLPGANVIAVHNPSGTVYGTSTRANGRFNITGMRVGGPYTITASFVGYNKQILENVFLELGQNLNLNFELVESQIELRDITVEAERSTIIRSDKTGTGTTIPRENLEILPTISRRIEDLIRLTPQASSNARIGGVDNRLNNITVDGSYFNNSFGLAGLPGDRTGVAPISLESIEQIQVNISPFDVRQGNFVGANINTVTRSGDNNYTGSIYYNYRNDDYVGKKAGNIEFKPGTFRFNQFGLTLSGPILRNKLFFFVNFETDNLITPGTTYRSNLGGEPVGGNVTRVLKSHLDSLSKFLKDNFNYETGPYEGYDHETPSTRFLLKLDYNINPKNKISLRYTHLDSFTDVLLSNSSSLGWGNRRTNLTGLNYQNSNYQIMENIRSIIAEWNSIISDKISNNLIVGYTFNDESRKSRGRLFPFVDILDGGQVYTSFGFEPFTPNNELRYWSFQIQNNLNLFLENHTLTFGFSLERYQSENVFFPGSQSVYVYNSLADFYNDARDYLNNPNRTTSPITLRRFQVRWSNIPGQEKPIQPLKVWYGGIYFQDQWEIFKNLNLISGIRFDVPVFEKTGYHNPEVDTMIFRDENGFPVQYRTDKMPDPKVLVSPRIGFNWDIFSDKTTQLRGGTGIFTGRPAYVWISNQIGNNGILTGFQRLDNVTNRPFHPDINRYKPTTVTGAPAASYELALTDPNFKFPQMWRTNIGLDRKLWFDFIGTVEFLYSKDINGIYYINANLRAPNAQFTGADTRPRWTGTNRIYSKVDNAIVLKNQNVGYYWNIAASLERPMINNFYTKIGYSYGIAKNTVDPGSIAFGSWNNNQHSGNPNNPGVGFSVNSPGHRLFGAFSYKLEYFDFGATTLTLFTDYFCPGNGSYTFSGDLNGDGGTSNDLIYIPKDKSEMNFQQYSVTIGSQTFIFTPQQQADAWDAFINQDPYLSKNRGKYAERNAAFLPMVFRADLSLVQDFHRSFFGFRNSLQLRIDVLNFTNLLNKNWGVAQTFTTLQPLISQGADNQGRALYRLANIGGELIKESFRKTSTISDVWRIQVGIRYLFN